MFKFRIAESVTVDLQDDPALDDEPDTDSGFTEDVFNDAEEPIENNADTVPENQPLYQGATITLAMSIMLIMSFGMRHQLTGVALSDLLVLIELHCLLPNLCRKSLRSIQSYFCNLKQPLEFHYYCQKQTCMKYFGQSNILRCTTCGEDCSVPAYFIMIPLANQLTSILSSK